MLQAATIDATSPRETHATELFGPLQVAEHQMFRFDDGLLGFPSCKRWMLIEGARAGTAWLQSVDHTSLAFLLVDPFVAFDGFAVELGHADLRRIDAAPDADLLVYALVTVSGEHATANLRGPLVIDVRTRRGMQVVLPESAWGLCETVPASVFAHTG